ncbi:MAG: FHA domain-containing protein [Candidatus Competibacteraceae bacterium]|nr:FHA domain-containing protein [Candidatus Competibacteraceae bacterium]
MTITEGGGSFTLEMPGFNDQLTLRFIAADSVFETTFTGQELTSAQSIRSTAGPEGESPAPLPLKTDPTTTASSSGSVAPSSNPTSPDALEAVNAWLWWAGLGAAGVVLLLLWFVIRRHLRATRSPLLALIEQPDSGQEFAVDSAIYRIGRAADNNLQLDNDSVSAYHAELRQRRDGVFSIADLDSTNGVWVNGKQVSSQALRDGDLFELGEVRLRFREAPPWGNDRA